MTVYVLPDVPMEREFDGSDLAILYLAVIDRAIHDACGATIIGSSMEVRVRLAQDAHNWLYNDRPYFRNERDLVCEYAGIEPSSLRARLLDAEIPWPTIDTIKNSWSILELAQWKLGGRIGPMPVPRPVRVEERPRRSRARGAYSPLIPRPARRVGGPSIIPTMLFGLTSQSQQS